VARGITDGKYKGITGGTAIFGITALRAMLKEKVGGDGKAFRPVTERPDFDVTGDLELWSLRSIAFWMFSCL
jgi:hypothetical protein